MAHFTLTTTRSQRLLSILLIGIIFLFLQVGEGVLISTQVSTHALTTLLAFYACYGVSALLFYCIGSLCWLYAYGKQHVVAALLFAFTSSMMIAFSSLSASALGNPLFSVLSGTSTTLAVLFFFFLLLHFPYAILTALTSQRARLLFRITCVVIVVLCVFTLVRDVSVYFFHYVEPTWWVFLGLTYYLLTATALIAVIVRSATRKSITIREQQQSRFFLLGAFLSFIPILGLTIVPTVLHAHFVIDGTLSVISLVLFPLTTGYAVLRYQLLVFDSYVKRVVITTISVLGLALLTFALLAIGSVVVSSTISFSLTGLLLVGVIGAPCIWWGCRFLTEHFFFPEAQYYKRVLKQVQQNRAEQSFDLQHVAHLLVIDTMTTLNAPGACVFVLDEETHAYSLLATPSHEAERTERVRNLLLSQVTECLSSEHEGTHIEGDLALIQQLQTAKRPLFWSEVAHPCEEEQSDRATRSVLIKGQQERRSGPLFASLRSPQGEMIGIILISERGDEQRYGGPDLEALVQLLHLSALPMETARQFHITMREQERTAHEREEAYEQQRQLNEMKDRLIIHMSHELRTPLSEVSGYLELMKDFGDALDSEHRATFLQKATHGCDELLSLLQQILDSTQSNASTASLKMEDVMLTSLLTQEVSHLDPTQVHSHEFAFQIDESLSVWADEQSIRQIMRNLLSNALKYSPDHSTVTVGTARDNSSVLLFVRNEGEGISREEMRLLFEKFVRLERHHSGSIRGTGLGLYICRQLTEAMGGQIWAESSGVEGEGTSFFVRLEQAAYMHV